MSLPKTVTIITPRKPFGPAQHRRNRATRRHLISLTIRDLIILLAWTEDQTRDLPSDTVETHATHRILRHQREILTELNRRDVTVEQPAQ